MRLEFLLGWDGSAAAIRRLDIGRRRVTSAGAWKLRRQILRWFLRDRGASGIDFLDLAAGFGFLGFLFLLLRLFWFVTGFGGIGFADFLDDERVVGEEQDVALMEQPEEIGGEFGGRGGAAFRQDGFPEAFEFGRACSRGSSRP